MKNQKSAAVELPPGDAGQVAAAVVEVPVSRIIIVHGDKGGVGKSMAATVLADQLLAAKKKMAVIDADTRNPDVIRMFEGADCAKIKLNLRDTEGWMDIMDFVHANPGYTFVVSMPAGIGETMQEEFAQFVRFMRQLRSDKLRVEIHMWWLLNLFVDSVNLLDQALKAHEGLFDKVVVVRNNIFGEPDKFIMWNESPLKTMIETSQNGQAFGQTVDLPPLHLRITSKLFDPERIVPYSTAVKEHMMPAMGFTVSERGKLEAWINDQVPKAFGSALSELTA